MQSLGGDKGREVFEEVLLDKLVVIEGYVKDLPLIKRKLELIKIDVQELKTDMKAIKLTVTPTPSNSGVMRRE